MTIFRKGFSQSPQLLLNGPGNSVELYLEDKKEDFLNNISKSSSGLRLFTNQLELYQVLFALPINHISPHLDLAHHGVTAVSKIAPPRHMGYKYRSVRFENLCGRSDSNTRVAHLSRTPSNGLSVRVGVEYILEPARFTLFFFSLKKKSKCNI
jgi:hypothetical protein